MPNPTHRSSLVQVPHALHAPDQPHTLCNMCPGMAPCTMCYVWGQDRHMLHVVCVAGAVTCHGSLAFGGQCLNLCAPPILFIAILKVMVCDKNSERPHQQLPRPAPGGRGPSLPLGWSQQLYCQHHVHWSRAHAACSTHTKPALQAESGS